MSTHVSMPTLSSVVNCKMEPHVFLAEGHLFSVPPLLLTLDTQHSKGISIEDNLAQEHVYHRSLTEDKSRMRTPDPPASTS